MKRWWLLLALLLSVGINVGILSVLAVHRLRPARPPAAALPPAAGVERLADHLELEGEERRRFVEIQRGFFESTREGRQRMHRLRRQLAGELTARRPDRDRVEAILAELTTTYAEIEGGFARLVLDTREILTPRQQRRYLRFLGRLRAGAEGRRPGPIRPGPRGFREGGRFPPEAGQPPPPGP